MDDDKLLTIKETSIIFGLGEPIISKLIRTEKIPHVRLGRRFVRLRYKDVKQWLESKNVLPKIGGNNAN